MHKSSLSYLYPDLYFYWFCKKSTLHVNVLLDFDPLRAIQFPYQLRNNTIEPRLFGYQLSGGPIILN